MKPVALLLCLLPSVLWADWRQFRGNDTTSVSSEPISLSDVARNDAVQWTAELIGRGLSSPVIVDGRVFVTTCSGLSQERLGVVCLDAETGERLWDRQVYATGRTVCHEKMSNAAPTSASDGRAIYSFYSSGDVTAYDLDGHLLWYRGLGGEFPNASNSLGMSSSLVVVDGVVVCMLETDADSKTFGLNTQTGQTAWQLDRPRKANWTSPSLYPTAAGPLVLLQSGDGVTAIRPNDGATVWSWDGGAATIPTLTVTDDQTLVVPSDGLTVLKPGDDSSDTNPPETLWNVGSLRPATASPVILDGRVYTLNRAGVMTAASLDDGQTAWKLRLKGKFSATPVVAGSLLYAVSEDGVLQVIEPGDDEGRIISERDFEDAVLATPSIAGGALYLRSDSHLWKLQ